MIRSMYLFAGLALAACTAETQDVAPEQPLLSGDAPVLDARVVDWGAARQARVDAAAAGQSTGMVSIQAEGTGSPVPVMLPSGIVMPQSARPTFRVSDSGYFAQYPGAKYDIIVNGTNQVYDTKAPDATAEERAAMKFTPMEAGAQVSFSRFGADYLVEFECRILDSENGCIAQDEAIEVAEGLFVAATE